MSYILNLKKLYNIAYKLLNNDKVMHLTCLIEYMIAFNREKLDMPFLYWLHIYKCLENSIDKKIRRKKLFISFRVLASYYNIFLHHPRIHKITTQTNRKIYSCLILTVK